MPAKRKIEVGSEIESMCTKCKDVTVHVVTALQGTKVTKVMCKSCLSYHKPKAQTSSAKKGKVVKKAAKSTTKSRTTKVKVQKTSEERRWNRLLKKVDDDQPVDYKMSDSYENIAVIEHPDFGVGVVTGVVSEKKIQVYFQDGEKILVQNWE